MVRKTPTCKHERRAVEKAIDRLSENLRGELTGVENVRPVIGDEYGDVEVVLSVKRSFDEGGDVLNVYNVEDIASSHGFKKGTAIVRHEPIRGQIDARLVMTFFYTYPEVEE